MELLFLKHVCVDGFEDIYRLSRRGMSRDVSDRITESVLTTGQTRDNILNVTSEQVKEDFDAEGS